MSFADCFKELHEIPVEEAVLSFREPTEFDRGIMYSILKDACSFDGRYESVGFVLYDRKENPGETAFAGDYLYYRIQL